MKTGTFEDMVNDFNNGTFNLTKNGKCTQCGKCCGNLLPMTDEEVLTIKNYIKKNNIKEHSHIVALLAKPTIDMTCPFLDDSKSCEKCTIYEVRPRICREFSCDPNQRTKLDPNYAIQCKPIDVREEFFR